MTSPITLSAIATCPAGVTPEYTFWTKNVGDANWQSNVLGGYTQQSSISVTSPLSGDVCFSVAARGVGSTDVYHVRSAGSCGTVDARPPIDVVGTILGIDFVPTAGVGGVLYGADGRAQTTIATTLTARLPLSSGSTVKSLTAQLYGDDVVDATIGARHVRADGTFTPIGEATFSDIQATDAAVDIADTTIGTGESVVVVVTAHGAQLLLMNTRFAYCSFDSPPVTVCVSFDTGERCAGPDGSGLCPLGCFATTCPR